MNRTSRPRGPCATLWLLLLSIANNILTTVLITWTTWKLRLAPNMTKTKRAHTSEHHRILSHYWIHSNGQTTIFKSTFLRKELSCQKPNSDDELSEFSTHQKHPTFHLNQINKKKKELRDKSRTALGVVVEEIKTSLTKLKESRAKFHREKAECETNLAEYNREMAEADIRLQVLGEAVESFNDICKFCFVNTMYIIIWISFCYCYCCLSHNVSFSFSLDAFDEMHMKDASPTVVLFYMV